MRIALAVLSFAFSLILICCQSAAALPAAPSAIGQSATTPSALQHAQYSERRTRHGYVKCYREFVVGRYVCHTYR